MTSTPLIASEHFVSFDHTGNPSGKKGAIASPEYALTENEKDPEGPDEAGASINLQDSIRSISVSPEDLEFDDGDLHPSLGFFVLVFTGVVVGLFFWVATIITVIFSGWDTLRLLAAYFAAGNAIILGIAVVFALLSSENYDLD